MTNVERVGQCLRWLERLNGNAEDWRRRRRHSIKRRDRQAVRRSDGEMQRVPGAQPEVMPVRKSGGGIEMRIGDRDGRYVAVEHLLPVREHRRTLVQCDRSGSELDRQGAGDFGRHPTADHQIAGRIVTEPAFDAVAIGFGGKEGDDD